MRESTPSSAIPAKAEIHTIRHSHARENPPHHPSFPRRRESTPSSVIPAKAGIHNSRARGNSTKRNTIQTNQTHHSHTELPSTSFPRTRESTPSSVIPAKAGIQFFRESTLGSTRNTVQDTSFPHRITFNVIPAYAGMDSRLRGNDGVFFRALGSWDDEFPRARELWIPAFAGMTDSMDSRLRGNDGVFFRALG